MNVSQFPVKATEEEMGRALDLLMSHFDIVDVSDHESEASLDYTQSRIDAAREALMKNPDPRERVICGAWLDFFQGKITGIRATRS